MNLLVSTREEKFAIISARKRKKTTSSKHSSDCWEMYSQHPLNRRPIIRTFANSNGFLIPFILFPFKIHPIIRTFTISNKFFGPVGVRINGCLL